MRRAQAEPAGDDRCRSARFSWSTTLPVERLALQEVLGRNGYQVLTAGNGEQAIARSRSDHPTSS